jgi:hypothetical protein
MTLRKIGGVVAFLGLVALAAPDRASAEYFEFGPPNQTDYVYITYAPGGFNNLEVYAGNYEGQIAASLNGGGGLANPITAFYTYCVDLTHEVSNGNIYQVNIYSTTGPDGLANNSGAAIAYLYEKYGGNGSPVSPASPLTINGDKYIGLSASDYAAAVQVAIWDELAGDTLTVTGAVTGPLTVTYASGSDPTAQAGGTGLGNLVSDLLYMANANSAGYTADYLRDVNYQLNNPNDGEQSFLIPSSQINPDIVAPEPSTFTLAGFSLVCVIPFGYWRRRRQYA